MVEGSWDLSQHTFENRRIQDLDRTQRNSNISNMPGSAFKHLNGSVAAITAVVYLYQLCRVLIKWFLLLFELCESQHEEIQQESDREAVIL